MKALACLCGLLAATWAVPAMARGLTVNQNHVANVFGLVQAGPQAKPVTVDQNGTYNIAGVIQAVPNPVLHVTQTGRRNTALVDQMTRPGFSFGSREMP